MSHDELMKTVAQWPLEFRDEWQERAAIMEMDGGFTREKAELEAYKIIQPLAEVLK